MTSGSGDYDYRQTNRRQNFGENQANFDQTRGNFGPRMDDQGRSDWNQGRRGYDQDQGMNDRGQREYGYGQGAYSQGNYGQGRFSQGTSGPNTLGASYGGWGAGGYGEYDQGNFGRGDFGQGRFGQWPAGQGAYDQGDFGRSSSGQGTYSQGQGAFEQNWMQGPHAGRGPRGYQRSDERIREDLNERLTQHGGIDATDIDVQVKNGEVTLSGTVDDRRQKRMAEDVAESIAGVKDVHNQLRLQQNQPGTSGAASQIPQTTPATAGNNRSAART